ncbi:hypothetical protein BIY27_08250 [Gibbsiella quercinecans]|nr:hypothetical protein BIY27_08250 [Gibbsiella quercinecans]
MVAWILRRAPDAGDAKLSATTLLVMVRTIDFPPGVTAADFNSPALLFSVSERFLNLFFRM